MIKRSSARMWLVGVLLVGCGEEGAQGTTTYVGPPTSNGCPFDAPFFIATGDPATEMCVAACPGDFDEMMICIDDSTTTEPTGSSSGDTGTTGNVGTASATVGTSDGSTSGDVTSDTSTSEGSDTGVPANGYGDCANHPAAEACIGDEICFGQRDVPLFCALPCMVGDVCPEASSGDASPTCATFGPKGGVCYLDCASGQQCPDGMSCGGGICIWESGGSVVPDAWTCADAAYDAGDGCDCGCAVPDPDCATGGVMSCGTCDGQGSCSTDACPGMIAPKDNASCI